MVRSFIILVVALGLTTTAFALAAQNTVDTSKAGDGSAAVSNYTVTGITYTLGSTPSDIASVDFDLDDTATNVVAGIADSSANEKYSDACTHSGTYHWTCNFTGVNVPTVLEAVSLRVIAAQ
jgi:hypothetical protein